MECDVVEINISEVKVGDMIEHNGIVHTVGRNNIKTGFMGITLYGDSYRLGTTPVKKLILRKPK